MGHEVPCSAQLKPCRWAAPYSAALKFRLVPLAGESRDISSTSTSSQEKGGIRETEKRSQRGQCEIRKDNKNEAGSTTRSVRYQISLASARKGGPSPGPETPHFAKNLCHSLQSRNPQPAAAWETHEFVIEAAVVGHIPRPFELLPETPTVHLFPHSPFAARPRAFGHSFRIPRHSSRPPGRSHVGWTGSTTRAPQLHEPEGFAKHISHLHLQFPIDKIRHRGMSRDASRFAKAPLRGSAPARQSTRVSDGIQAWISSPEPSTKADQTLVGRPSSMRPLS